MEKEIILNKIAYLKENIQKTKVRIEKYKTEKNIEEKETLELAVSKIIEEIVETAIKINNILLEKNKSYASTYFQTFSKLNQFYNIDSDLILKLAKTTSIRNKVTHEYSKMNKKDLIKKYSSFIPLYEEYIKFIIKNI